MISNRIIAVIILVVLSALFSKATTVNVRGDYPGIQAAINSAEDGDEILVHGGEFQENLTINKSISIKGINTESGIPIIMPVTGDNAITLLNDGITLSGFRISNEGGKVKTCISLNSDENSIYDMDLIGSSVNDIGISLNDSKNNKIFNCTFKKIYHAAIDVVKSSSNKIDNNTILDCQVGISIAESSGNILANDAFLNNAYGIVFGNTIDEMENIEINCTFNHTPIPRATLPIIGDQ